MFWKRICINFPSDAEKSTAQTVVSAELHDQLIKIIIIFECAKNTVFIAYLLTNTKKLKIKPIIIKIGVFANEM
jgi:hypothetical protein